MDLKFTGVSLTVLLYRFGAAGMIFLSLAIASYAVGSAPTRVASRLGLRGLKRQRALAVERAHGPPIEPLVRWLGVRVSGIPTEEQRAALDRQISLAGDFLGLTAEEYLALYILSARRAARRRSARSASSSTWSRCSRSSVVVLGAVAPYMIVSGEAQERIKNISRGLPYVIDLMALAMGAGLDFPGAVRQVVDKSSNPERPARRGVHAHPPDARTSVARARTRCSTFATRAPAASVSSSSTRSCRPRSAAIPSPRSSSIQAGTSRTRRSVRAEELAAKAGVKMTGPLMLDLPRGSRRSSSHLR